jgi:nitrogen-specific signal transduction histidine kinase
MHRGSVDVGSHHGRTVFRVSLPVAFDHEEA